MGWRQEVELLFVIWKDAGISFCLQSTKQNKLNKTTLLGQFSPPFQIGQDVLANLSHPALMCLLKIQTGCFAVGRITGKPRDT